jgi:predicted AlkP superfamily phosphohydrolase/phosphomutase
MAAPGHGPTVVYALDSADLDLLERWMAEGRLPHIAELWRNSARRRIGGPGYWDEIGTWITAYSGVPATRHGYYSARRLKPGTYDLEIVPLTAARARPCWESVQDPRFRALILEPIEGFPSSHTAGAQLYNLTAHQESYAAAPVIAMPDPVEAQTRRIYGKRRIPRFDRFHEPLRFYQQQLELNLDMLRRKGRLFCDLIRRNEFDLLVAGINLHDVGHMLWPFQEGRHDPRDPEGRLAHGLRSFYEEADREIGEMQKLLPAGSTEVLLSVYGIKDQYPTQELSTRLMELLGYHVPLARQGGSWGPLGIARRVLPEPWRFQLSQGLPDGWQQALLRSAFPHSMDFRRSRAFVLPTSLYTAQIRVNLQGREPTGCVAPGRDYEGLLDQIEREFRSVIDPVTGEPAVASVLRTANAFIDGPSEFLPDLYVHWKSSRHFLERALHPKGEVTQRRPRFFRDSYHRAPGFAAFKGPAIEPGWFEESSLLDIAPTLMGLLGERPLASMPGRDLLAS